MVNLTPAPVNEPPHRPAPLPAQGASRRIAAYGGTFEICGKTKAPGAHRDLWISDQNQLIVSVRRRAPAWGNGNP